MWFMVYHGDVSFSPGFKHLFYPNSNELIIITIVCFSTAAELFSTDGLAQYVDPSNYGDPMEAVRTFAAEIEENQIKLESTIGGGV